MDLHDRPREVVQKLLEDYGQWFSALRGYLDLAIQEVGARWEPTIPDLDQVDPCVRAGEVRQETWANLAQYWKESNSPLQLKLVSFAGLHVHTPEGWHIRTKKYPRNPRTGVKLTVAELQQNLFGEPPEIGSFEISLLWEIDLMTKTLQAAHLAAMDWKDEVGDTGPPIIYYVDEIPPPAAGGLLGGELNAGGSPGAPDATEQDDFEEFLGDGEEETGPTPA